MITTVEPELDIEKRDEHGLEKDGEIVPYVQSACGKSPRWVFLTPYKMVSWDNSRLPG